MTDAKRVDASAEAKNPETAPIEQSKKAESTNATSLRCGWCWGTGYVDGEDEYGCWWGPCDVCGGSGSRA